ncbi:putative two-component system sensor kinase [Actinoplanes missouriensis 431]|uniref:histidine kinase n=1 Tax=Actinoplanes missouriensis (strain ATCC 14538 / DSM 43046 / CBS 188.64 / JCM 3121 / NBRC 102363 / NCIMB 12654 / NRRL B-3342 / UNCC 431) TaxID=512565 RepID=I0H4M7_ACTM4|nr:sensor histidine kinase [Actinoplanes missouriensis]BAL87964.1 putative two-component system sensor kinase [Actinoplanes missouriensis 431]
MPIPPRRLSPGGWVALLWSIAVFWALRGYSGLPGLPSVMSPRPAWCWAVVAAAAMTGLGASTRIRRRPLTALYLLVVCALAILLAVGPPGLAAHPDQMLGLFLLAADLVLARVVMTRRAWTWGVALLPVLVSLPAAALLRVVFRQPFPGDDVGVAIDGTLWLAYVVLPALVAGLLGYTVRQAGEYARRLREQAADQAVMAERLRISRELHDHVAHSVGVIALQAGAAARVMDTQPDRAREAMLAIEATSRDTLAGLRRMLGGLRHATEAPLRPAPGLADLDHLVATAAAAGVAVDLIVSGERRSLAADVELSAYRIIQESLTNVLRHAHAETCRIAVDYRPGELAIEVSDDGRGGDPATGGFGLTGLRERVALLDGTLTAGARRGGGFQVAARLPVGA